VGADVFPDDVAFAGDLEQAAILSFIDQGIAVGQALGTADEGAVERPRRLAGHRAGILPDDLLGFGVDFDDARRREKVRLDRRHTGVALFVEYQQVARAGQPFGNEMRIVRAHGLIHRTRQFAVDFHRRVIRPQAPHNVTAVFVDDGYDIDVARVDQNVIWRKT